MPFRILIVLFFAAMSALAVAEDAPEELIPLPDQPDIPPPVESGQPMQPDVTIIHRGKDLVEEYRINNKLYMVKIKPSIGPAYYLIDNDGDGMMDEQKSDIEKGTNSPRVPQWVLFSW